MPSQRRILPARISRNQAEKAAQIADEASERHRCGQPVLIGTHSIAESQRIAETFDKHRLAYSLLNGIQDDAEADVIASAGISGAVTIATNMAGRGTDIQIDSAAEQAGGLHVIVSQPHPIARVDRQLIGRTARGGNPGTVRFFYAPDDDVVRQSAPWIVRQIERELQNTHLNTSAIEAQIARVQSRNEKSASYQRRTLLEQELSDQELLAR